MKVLPCYCRRKAKGRGFRYRLGRGSRMVAALMGDTGEAIIRAEQLSGGIAGGGVSTLVHLRDG